MHEHPHHEYPKIVRTCMSEGHGGADGARERFVRLAPMTKTRRCLGVSHLDAAIATIVIAAIGAAILFL